MKFRFFRHLLLLFILTSGIIIGEVPAAKTRKPNIPYLGQSINFQTIEMKIFSPFTTGMFPDRYSDLILNPASIMSNDTTSLYLDFNADNYENPVLSPLVLNELYDTQTISPRWYGYTTRSSVQTNPLYNFAALVPLSSTFSLAVFNRSLFDYGPFLSAQSYATGRGDELAMDYANMNIEPKRDEIDNNQQSVKGNQSEVVLGMSIYPALDLGLRLGSYFFDRDGTLYDSKWANYNHSSFSDLNDEHLEINGHHFECGIGALYHISKKMDAGLYGRLIWGKADENTGILDTSYTWSEQAGNTAYYSMLHPFLKSSDQYHSKIYIPRLALIYQWKIKENVLWRTGISYSSGKNDLTGANTSLDTTSSDRTYDQWISTDTYAFRRQEHEQIRKSSFSGKGQEKMNTIAFYSSLIYLPDEEWSLFSGIGFNRVYTTYHIDESSQYYSNSIDIFSFYDPQTSGLLYKEKSIYNLDTERCEWNLIIPVGMKTHIYKGLYLLIGTDITLTMADENANSRLFFPEKLTRRTEDSTVIDEPDNDRLETYSSNPPKNFTRTVTNRFGLTYQHTSGFTVYLKSSGNIFTTGNWAFGFGLFL